MTRLYVGYTIISGAQRNNVHFFKWVRNIARCIYLFIYLNMHGFAYEYFMSLLHTSKSTTRSFKEDNVVIL